MIKSVNNKFQYLKDKIVNNDQEYQQQILVLKGKNS